MCLPVNYSCSACHGTNASGAAKRAKLIGNTVSANWRSIEAPNVVASHYALHQARREPGESIPALPSVLCKAELKEVSQKLYLRVIKMNRTTLDYAAYSMIAVGSVGAYLGQWGIVALFNGTAALFLLASEIKYYQKAGREV